MFFPSISTLFILHLTSASEWDKQSAAECQDLLHSKGLVTPLPNSKYITVTHPGGVFDVLVNQNGNYEGTKEYCEYNNLELPYTSHYVDWMSLQELSRLYFNSQELTIRHQNASYKPYEGDDNKVFARFFVTAMKFKFLGPKELQGTVQDYDASAPVYILYGPRDPAGNSGGVFLGIAKAKLKSGSFKLSMVAQTYKRETKATRHSYNLFAYPALCMYPSNSNCYKLSQEETELIGNQKADNLFYMTDAFRGYWNIASKPRTREAGAKFCEDNDAGFMLNSSLYELPWSHGKSFRWDLNRIYRAYVSILRDQLDLFPYVGFHGKEGREYYFEFNTTAAPGDPHKHHYESFQPALIDQSLHPTDKTKTEIYATESIVLCYKPFRCAGEGRKRRDVRRTCKKRRWG